MKNKAIICLIFGILAIMSAAVSAQTITGEESTMTKIKESIVANRLLETLPYKGNPDFPGVMLGWEQVKQIGFSPNIFIANRVKEQYKNFGELECGNHIPKGSIGDGDCHMSGGGGASDAYPAYSAMSSLRASRITCGNGIQTNGIYISISIETVNGQTKEKYSHNLKETYGNGINRCELMCGASPRCDGVDPKDARDICKTCVYQGINRLGQRDNDPGPPFIFKAADYCLKYPEWCWKWTKEVLS
ncbi:MAG: hypothetical protein HZB65_05275 [Candidatus Aenigmarchaeota archaeon]|nr:hypothetical protein [Candidatus Aenigmarchaeota archaeon]